MAADAKKIANAVARLVAGSSDYRTEAQATGISVRTLKRRVAEVRAAAPPAPDGTNGTGANVPSAMALSVTPQGEGQKVAPPGPNVALEKALAAAGEGTNGPAPGTGATSATPAALADMRSFVVDTAQSIRGASIEMLVRFRYGSVLRPDDPEVVRLTKLGPMASTAIAANAERLYPHCVKLMNGWAPVAFAFGWDTLGSWMQLHQLATSRGWKGGEKKERRRDRDDRSGQVHQFEELRRAVQESRQRAQEPPEELVTENRTDGPYGQIADAPPPPRR